MKIGFFPGWANMYPKSSLQVGQFLPVVPGHPVEERAFPMDHLIVGEAEHVIL